MNHALKSVGVVAVLLACASSSSGAQLEQSLTIPTHAAASLDASLLTSATPFARALRESSPEVATPVTDGMLGAVLAAALIALQLRRRQKSLRTPRLRSE
jgi:hypothetical protein